MKKKLYALSGVFLIVLAIAGLWATKATDTMQTIDSPVTSLAPGLSMKEMVEVSPLILMGKCLDTRSEWVGGRRLVTVATVEVTETLKGAATGTVKVVLPGGRDSNRAIPVAMTYAGAPRISQSEQVFLFLTPEGQVANGYSVMGFSAGKFSVAEGSAGEKVVTRDMTRMRIQTGMGVMRGNTQAIPLEEFKKLVESYLR